MNAWFKNSVRIWLVLALAAALGGLSGCGKKKDKKPSGETVIPHHNPAGMSPISRRGVRTPLPQAGSRPQGGPIVVQPEIREALDLLVMFGGAPGTEYMRGIMMDLESGQILIRFPGANYSRYQLPDKAGATVDVCLSRYQSKTEQDQTVDPELFKSCQQPLIINLKSLAQFGNSQRLKLRGDAHAIRLAYAHVLAAQWVASRTWREDRETLKQQPNLLRALFASEDVAWKDGSGVSEVNARTLRALFLIYRQTIALDVSRKLGAAGMPHPLLDRLLSDSDLTVKHYARQLGEQQGVELSEDLLNELIEASRGTTSFTKYFEKLQKGEATKTLFARALAELS